MDNIITYKSIPFWLDLFPQPTVVAAGTPTESLQKQLAGYVLTLLEFCWCARISNPRLKFRWPLVEQALNTSLGKPVRLSNVVPSKVTSVVYPALVVSVGPGGDNIELCDTDVVLEKSLVHLA